MSKKEELEKSFLEKLSACGIPFYKMGKDKYRPYLAERHIPKGRKETLAFDDYLYSQWNSGGVTGGSCWDEGGTDPHYPVEGEPEPEFTDIDEALTALCPNLSFLQYKKLMASGIVEIGSYSENEYYGNYTTYTYKSIKLRKLFDKLFDMGLLKN